MDIIKSDVNEEVKEMKKVFWGLGLTLVFNLAGAAYAQKNSTNSADKMTKQSVSAQGSGSANASAGSSALSAATNLQAELQNTLDVKNAKVGDQVILKTTQAIKQGGQVVVPKGSQLIGRVTEVQQRAKNGAASRLGLVFDRIQGHDLSMPITATINSITNLRAANSVGDDLSSDISGSSTASGRASSGGGSSSGGGGLLGGVTNTVGGALNSTTQTVGGVANTATSTVGSTVSGTTQTVGRTVNGIQILTSASGSAQSSTTLSSPNSNIHLEKGVTFDLNVQKSGGN
ncbi:MAG TPA: hypothetical protein VEV84_10985 [Pyrinomonadaceae bacterium]|nr:hypothetical protein [Pyrinomonadaceae bacterium]